MMVKVFRIFTFIAISALAALSDSAIAVNQGLTYQGRILKADGQPLQATAVQFVFLITDPTGNCVLYSEALTTNMAGSAGNFSLNVGSGIRLDGGSHTWKQVFTNAGTLSSLNCGSGSTYTPAATDERLLKVTFNDGSGAQPISAMSIRAAPFALQADQVSGYGTANLAKISGSGSANIFSPFQHDFLFNLSATGIASSTPCVTGEILKFNGTSWACGADSTGGSPGDASYAAKGILQFNIDAATSGVVVSAGIVTINTGLGANQIPKYDASANLGIGVSATSKLDVNGAITQRGMAVPASSAAGTGRIYFDSTSNKFRVSENTGAYVDLLSGSTSLSGDVSGTSSTTSVDKIKGTALSISALTSGNFLRYNGTNWVNTNLVAADVPSLDASKITSGLLGVANGGTGASSIGSGNLVVGAGTGAVTSLASGASGNVVYGTGLTSWTSGTPDAAGLIDKSSVQSIGGAKTFGATLKMSNQNLFSLGDTGSNAVSFRAPATVATSYSLTMPVAQGGASSVLVNDGSGNLTWVENTFITDTNNGFYIPDDGKLSIYVNGNESIRFQIGNVGIGTTSPSVKLDVAGAIRPGDQTVVTVCGSGAVNGEGSIRYNSTSKVMEFCNGTDWTSFGSSGGGGGTASCTGTPWGTLAHGAVVTAYSTASPAGVACSTVSETRTCVNGLLTGSYANTACNSGCSTGWGNLTHGQSVTAWNASSSCTCGSETRTCSNGTFTGSYGYGSCTALSCDGSN